MKTTIAQLRAAVVRAGGTLEEDTTSHCARCFQAVAPKGCLWLCDGIRCLRIDWPLGGLPWTEEGRREALQDVTQRVACGHRPMTAEERYDYEEDES